MHRFLRSRALTTLFASVTVFSTTFSATLLTARLVEEGMQSAGGRSVQRPVFTDAVPEWASDAIGKLSGLGIITGYQDGRFGSADPVRRGQIATLLYRMLRHAGILEGEPLQCKQEFEDVPKGHYAYLPLCALRKANLLDGGFAFRPDEPANRGVTAMMMNRAIGARMLEGLGMSQEDALVNAPTFQDVPLDSLYYEAASLMSSIEIMKGYPTGAFGPLDGLNRAQAAVALHRLLQKVEEFPAMSEVPTHESEPTEEPEQPSGEEHAAAPACDADLRNDPENCGACANVCPSGNGYATCEKGNCILRCDGLWEDQDGDPLNGCETQGSAEEEVPPGEEVEWIEVEVEVEEEVPLEEVAPEQSEPQSGITEGTPDALPQEGEPASSTAQGRSSVSSVAASIPTISLPSTIKLPIASRASVVKVSSASAATSSAAALPVRSAQSSTVAIPRLMITPTTSSSKAVSSSSAAIQRVASSSVVKISSSSTATLKIPSTQLIIPTTLSKSSASLTKQ